MAEITVVYEAVCEKCGSFLDVKTRDGRGGPEIVVTPCEKCGAIARKVAYDEGYKQAEEDMSFTPAKVGS